MKDEIMLKQVRTQALNIPDVMNSGFKFLDDETEIVIIAKTYEDAVIQIEKLNAEHRNGYRYLGIIPIYHCS